MKKADQKIKKRMRDKNLLASGAQPGIQEGQLSQEGKEGKSRGSQVTPKKEVEKRREDRSAVFRYVGIAGQFLKESRMELKKVKWPTKKELLASTAAVIVLVVVIGLYLGLIDFGLIKIIKTIVG